MQWVRRKSSRKAGFFFISNCRHTSLTAFVMRDMSTGRPLMNMNCRSLVLRPTPSPVLEMNPVSFPTSSPRSISSGSRLRRNLGPNTDPARSFMVVPPAHVSTVWRLPSVLSLQVMRTPEEIMAYAWSRQVSLLSCVFRFFMNSR